MNYQPNPVARSLVTRRTATIGLVMSDVRNPLYPPVTVGAEAACREAGYGLLLATAADPESELRAVELMYAKRVDALVVFSVSFVDPDNERLEELQQRGFPDRADQPLAGATIHRSRRSGSIMRAAPIRRPGT